MTEKKGIKETMDLIDAIDALVVAYDVANDDGKLDWTDLPKLAPVFVKFYDALKGMSEIPVELKDLDAEEAQIIAQKSVDIFITLIRNVMQDKVPA